MEDGSIVDMFLMRDESAIGCTKEKYGSILRHLAYEITKDAENAEECENDVYLCAWNSIPPHKPYHYFLPFLTKITRDVALSCFRKRNVGKRRAFIDELTKELENAIPAAGSMDDYMDEMVLRDILNRFLDGLPKEMRSVFIRRYWYLDSIQCIADGYGMSTSKVKSILYRCRNQLKIFLEKDGYML